MIGRLVHAAGVLVVACVLLLGLGFLWFDVVARQAAAPPPHADGIVVLTGGADRVNTALRLLQAGGSDRLLVSGVAHGAGLHDLGRHLDFDPASLASQVTLGHAATSTFGNAAETAAWVRDNAIQSLVVVTAGYHMPRALLEFGRTMPTVALYPYPVASPAMHDTGQLRLMGWEYLKFLAAWCGLSQAFDAREHPVGKYVNE